MPVVGKYEADIQMRADKAIPMVSESDAREAGERIARFGQNAVAFGDALYRQEQAIEKTDKQIKFSEFQTYAKETDDFTENQAYGAASEDGRDLVQIYDTQYKKTIDKKINDENDPDLKHAYQIEADEIRAKKIGKLFPDSRKMFKDYAGKAFDNQLNVASARVTKNPYNYDQEWEDYSKTISNSILGDAEKTKALAGGKKSLSKSAIDSFIIAEDFDGARQALTTKFAESFDTEERTKYLESIKTKELRASEIQFRDEDNNLKRAREQKGFVQERNFQASLNLINRLSQNSAVTNEKDIRAIEDDLQLQVVKGTLKPERAEMLRQVLRNEDVEDSPLIANQFYSSLADDDELPALKEQVAHAAAEKQISTKTALDLFKVIGSRQNSQVRTGPVSKNDPRVSAALEYIKDSVPKNQFSGARDNKKLYDMRKQFWDNMQNPAFGNNPDKALKSVLKGYVGGKTDKSIKALGLQGNSSPQEVLNTAKHLSSKNQIDKKTYLEILRAQKARLNELSDVNDRKNGGK